MVNSLTSNYLIKIGNETLKNDLINTYPSLNIQ